MSRTVLVTGGLGYIGSFTSLALLNAGHNVVIVDNGANGSEECLNRIEILSGRRPEFRSVDITNQDALDNVFAEFPAIEDVIHFAALKAVGESGEIPLDYYNVNVYGSLCLLRAMDKYGVNNIVFSSSATVYGDATRFPDMIPIPERCPLGPTNTYGHTKVTVEQMIEAWVNSKRNAAKAKGQSVDAYNGVFLRYFNPAGAHPSGIMGEDPTGIPYNLLPLLAQVAVGKREKIFIFGDDYDSKDGTAIRDYIHILDLARGHVVALDYLHTNYPGVKAWNLGTGKGSTVYDMVAAFSKASGKQLAYEVKPRRDGDVLDLTANPTLANTELKWKAEHTLEEACADLWKWTENNPNGYRDPAPPAFVEAVLAARKKSE